MPPQAPLKPCHPGPTIDQQLQRLSGLLHDHALLWRPLPFTELELPWQALHPDLAEWLDGLTDLQLADPNRAWLQQGPPWLAELAHQLQEASTLPWLPQLAMPALGAVAMRRVPGRKVEQMNGFCAAVLPQISAARAVVDWCAGKSHLGRTLARITGATLLALEIDPELVSKGQQECDHLGLAARFECADVLDPATVHWLQPDQWVVALHACGDLHAALLRAAAERQVRGVALAPCCYNLVKHPESRALSRLGRSARLELAAADLDLVHREPVVVAGSDWARSQQEQAWRLAFDLVQRDLTGSTHYRTMPSFPRTWLRLPFAEFCFLFGPLDNLVVPADMAWRAYESRGWERLAQVRRRELVRGLFRAPLETWLVLDRAQVLVEAGFAVQVGQFCERGASPRNTMILATFCA